MAEGDESFTTDVTAYHEWAKGKIEDISHDTDALIKMLGDEKMGESFDSGMLAGLLGNRGIDPGIVAMLDNRARSGDWGDGGFLTLLFLIILMGGNGFGGWGRGGYGIGQEMGHDDINHTIINEGNFNQLLTAISQTGQNQTAAIQSLANNLNTDYNMVAGALAGVDKQLAINNGDIKSAIQQCCCNMRLELEKTSNQTNLGMERGFNGINTQLLTGFNGLQNQASQIAFAQQSQASQNTASITGAIADLKTAMVDEFCSLHRRELEQQIQNLRDINASQRDAANTQAILTAIANMNELRGTVTGTLDTTAGTFAGTTTGTLS
ncbi:MAG: hypothetical protein IJV02_06690 [Candidatus Methanomethylophilaceae archaeon]|nr:hypothetical protein [Candidatus Methanomethylophilaceae archaeon]